VCDSRSLQAGKKNVRDNQSFVLNSLCEYGPLYIKDNHHRGASAEQKTMDKHFLHADDVEKEEAVIVLFR
jgi:hypothetical protein